MANSRSNSRLVRWSVSEIRQGQLWTIAAALTLIIACIFALTALANRMEQVIVKQGKQALTADVQFSSSNPLPETLLQNAAALNMDAARQTRFATMAFSDAQMKLVTVKAVESNYPLQGDFRLSDGQGEKARVAPEAMCSTAPRWWKVLLMIFAPSPPISKVCRT